MSSYLENERKPASFNSNTLAKVFYTANGDNSLSMFLRVQRIVANDPILRFDPSELELSRTDLIKLAAKKTARVHEIFGLDNPLNFSYHFLINQSVFGGIHTVMFLPTIANLGTKEQFLKYSKGADSKKIFGCYAQTELGHGSDVQSLETTATYDHITEEFVLHSPTISSIKWWPGGLGLSATHAVTHARLYSNGKHYGVQTFVVQLRDLETHLPLKGITIGDIGPKLGVNTIDNGYLRFNKVRIPREGLLMKYVKLDKEGKFMKEGNEKIAYATMMHVRLRLIEGAYLSLSLASTIALRYSAFRKQFKNSQGREIVILDYQLQLNKLLPLLATIYGMNAGYKKIVIMYHQMMKKINENKDFSIMPELHSLLSGCKSFYTWETLNGIEVCRQACGGQGFSDYSGIPSIFRSYSPNVTLEGDNTVMALQTAKQLVSSAQKAMKGERLFGSITYIELIKDVANMQQCPVKTKDELCSLDTLNHILQVNSVTLLWRALKKISNYVKEQGIPFKEVWDTKVGLDLFAASRAHIHSFTFTSFMHMIKQDVKDEKISAVLTKLCAFYGIHKLLEHPLGVATSGYLLPEHFDYLIEKKEDLLEQLRPEAIALTDAFSFMDESLHSALAVSDGSVYETLLKWATESNSLNKEVPNEGFMKYMKPVMGKYSHLNPKPKL